MEEKLDSIIHLLENLAGLAAPVVIVSVLIFICVAFRFVSWFVDEMEKNDEAKYLRLKKKYESQDHNDIKK